MAKDAGGSLGLIVIDYLQLMAGSGSDENRATELGEITRELKGMGRELNCAVLLLSQLNRSVESRHDKRPMMSDLRDSGAIEQDADVVAFIYRDDYYTKEASREPGVAEIILAKQRSGPVCTVKLGWAGDITSFYTLAADYEPGRAQAAPAERGFD
jgi:replicative DNA helicase